MKLDEEELRSVKAGLRMVVLMATLVAMLPVAFPLLAICLSNK